MILGILQARFSSTRLPGKVLRDLIGKPMLARQIERLQRSKKMDRLMVATSAEASDDPVEELCKSLGVDCFRGSLEDVLDRFYQAALTRRPEHVVRLTGDCPLADPEVIDQVIEFHLNEKADYSSNAIEPNYPDGLDVEVFRFPVLADAWREARKGAEREHVTPFIHGNPQRFSVKHFRYSPDLSSMRWTVDTPSDFAFVEAVYGKLYPVKPDFGMHDVLELLEKNPGLSEINQGTKRNEGLEMSQKKDQYRTRYEKSAAMLERALRTIPLGSQTFSKSKTQYPEGVSPYFVVRGKGSRVWDVDGNEYIDFGNSLCSINLGYNDPEVTAAVRKQLDDGVIFTLPHPLEHQVAEKLVEMVPCAEMVRFGKNGSDATSGAVRLARAYTKRDRVAVCGYHGWQDWYIGSTARNRGVPKATSDLTHPFMYNDIESLRKVFKDFPGQVAAVIMEPMNIEYPRAGFLEEVKELTHKEGAVLIFDETITGFRFANGGAQEKFGVTPDLATFGKGLANGYPVSAVAGKASIMKLMEEIFFSFTFGGETLSLAAALASMTKLQTQPVIKHMEKVGDRLMKGAKSIIEKNDLGAFLDIKGSPCWSFVVTKDTPKYTSWQLKTLYLQEVFLRGFLTIGTHNISFAHSESDIDALLAAYEEVFPMLGEAVKNGDLDKRLHCKPLEPLFKVR